MHGPDLTTIPDATALRPLAESAAPYDPAVTSRLLTVAGVQVPSFVYGTAWKELETERLTRLALEAGFRGIDTANQRRHYFERRRRWARPSGPPSPTGLATRRRALHPDQVHVDAAVRITASPTTPQADDATQVRQSLRELPRAPAASSGIDSTSCTGPSVRIGLSRVTTSEVWDAMERLHGARARPRLHRREQRGRCDQLEELYGERDRDAGRSSRTAASPGCGWDRDDPRVLPRARHRLPGLLAAHARTSRTQARPPSRRDCQDAWGGRRGRSFALRSGLAHRKPLTEATTDSAHMREDLGMYDFELLPLATCASSRRSSQGGAAARADTFPAPSSGIRDSSRQPAAHFTSRSIAARGPPGACESIRDPLPSGTSSPRSGCSPRARRDRRRFTTSGHRQ